METKTENTEEKKRNVTVKTLKAWMEQTERIIANDELLNEKEQTDLLRLKIKVKENFIKTQF